MDTPDTLDTFDTLPIPGTQSGPPTLFASKSSKSPPLGKCHDVWLAVRVSTVAENSEQAEQKAFDTFENLVLLQTGDAEGEQAQVHFPPVLFNEVAIHVLNHMRKVGL